MNQNPSYAAYLPAPIRYDNRLPPSAKLMYGEITALSNKEGYCWAGNQYFADLYKVDKRTVSAWVNLLHKLGYVRVVVNKNQGNGRRIYLAGPVRIVEPEWYDLWKKSSIGQEENFYSYSEKLPHNSILNNISSNEESTRMNALSELGGDSVGLDSKVENVEEGQPPKKPNRSKSVAATTSLVLTSCKFPEHWTDAMKEMYAAKWIPFRQKVARKLLLLESAQAQIEKLADLTGGQLTACIGDSIANGWAGLFPDKYGQCANEQSNRTTSSRSGYQAEETKAKTPQIQQSGVVR